MEITYQSIQQLVLDSRVENNKMICQFGQSGRVVEAESIITKSNTVQNRVMDSVKRTVFNNLRRMAYSTIRKALGNGMLGQTGTTVVNSALRSNDLIKTYSAGDKEKAIVDAFKSVFNQFIYNSAISQWEIATNLSEYEKMLKANPIDNNFDREIFERMLVQVANVSEGISMEEQEFLYEHLGMSPLKIEEISLADPVLAVEAEEVSPNAKETIFLLLYTIAMIDHELDEAEEKLLNRYALMFDFSDEKIKKIETIAQSYILESAFRMKISREDLLELARQLRMDPEEAIRARIKYLKNRVN